MTVTRQDLKIGIAMSGGGLRAAVFHFGTLARLAEDDLLENVTFVSTVSGGSLAMGLILTHSGGTFPSSKDYLSKTVPQLKGLITGVDPGKVFRRRVLTSIPLIVRRTANDFARQLESSWNVSLNVKDLPETPRWLINAACYETGKNWRFMKKRMGDYEFGSTSEPDIPISAAMAASSAIPFLIGPYVLDTEDLEWFKYDDFNKTYAIEPPFAKVHLYDGALYDNHGLEALNKRKKSEIDFLVVSNGSEKIADKRFRLGPKSYFRMIEIVYRQSVSLYSRSFISHYLGCLGRDGTYFQFGNSAQYILSKAERTDALDDLAHVLSDADHNVASSVGLIRMRLTLEEFKQLFLHGYEIANCTLYVYHSNDFELKSEFPTV